MTMTIELNDGFQKINKRSGKFGTSVSCRKRFETILEECRVVIRDSLMFAKIREFLEERKNDIRCVRCLALGCFSEDAPARYQLALLLEINAVISLEKCSLYDPAFSEEDLAFIGRNDKWVVEETLIFDNDRGADSILFFLPHAPLNVTEHVLICESPKYWLANNLLRHTDRYTKLQLYEKYPHISVLTNFLNNGSKTKFEDDGFTTFSSKRRRNKKKVFREVEIDYSTVDSQYTECEILLDFENGTLLQNNHWNNAFSDLALHYMEK